VGVKIRESKGKIYLDFYYHGKRWWESTGLTIPADKQLAKEVFRLAETIRTKKEMSIVARQNNVLDPTAGKGLLYQYLEESVKGKSTQYAIHKVVHWVKTLRPGTRLEDLNTAWMERFQEELLSVAGVTAQTCEHYCNSLRAQFKRMYRDKIIANDPGEGVKHIKVKKKMKPFLEDWEIQKLIETPIGGQKTGIGPAIRQAWFFGLVTGLRVSDLRSLKWGDIDVVARKILKGQIKTDEDVSIPIKAEGWALIDDGIKHSPGDFVFPRIAAVKNIENTNPYLHKWGVDAGLTKAIGWHIARHTNATDLLESGADVYTVMKLLGHSKIETTMSYAAVTSRKKKAAVDALPEYGFEVKK
jgi:site-specific recombinase XerD